MELVHSFPSGPFSTNAYVIFCSVTKQSAVIDPSLDSSAAIFSYLGQHGLNCSKILLTHSHWDHIADVAVIKRVTHALVYIHALDVPNLEYPGSDKLPCWVSIEGVKPDVILAEGDQVTVGNCNFSVIHTPGHSPGSVCFYDDVNHILFSGDTLFQGAIGNLHFPTSQPDLMWSSLEKLNRLPSQTIVYPGHGPQTIIGAESWLPQAKEIFGKQF